MTSPSHVPVLLDRVVALLAPALGHDGAVLVDATLGLGGHTEAVLERCTLARVVGIDRDPQALDLARERLAPFGTRFTGVQAVYDEIPEVLEDLGLDAVDAVLFDLGVSSLQLDVVERGFAYREDAPLDMRMGGGSGLTAGALSLSGRELLVGGSVTGDVAASASSAITLRGSSAEITDDVTLTASTLFGIGAVGGDLTVNAGSTVRVGDEGFSVAPSLGNAVYLDATSGVSGNTTLAAGGTFSPPLNGTTGADNNWEQRTPFASGGNVYESGGEVAENAPQLKTTVTGLVAGHPATAGDGDPPVERDGELEGDVRAPLRDPGPPSLVMPPRLGEVEELDLDPGRAEPFRPATGLRVWVGASGDHMCDARLEDPLDAGRRPPVVRARLHRDVQRRASGRLAGRVERHDLGVPSSSRLADAFAEHFPLG